MVYAYFKNLLGPLTDKSLGLIRKWSAEHSVLVDVYVGEDIHTQKASFDKRKLSTDILPRLKQGDVLITSELSCLGRSAVELDNVLNHILKGKLVRVICIPFDLDVDFANLTTSDESMLGKIAYAAKLHKFLAQEVTRYALLTRSADGVKIGGASSKYHETMSKKSSTEIERMHMQKGATRRRKFLNRKETITFINVLREVFKDACPDDIRLWNWSQINTKADNRFKIMSLLKLSHDSDVSLFSDWDFSGDLMSFQLQQKLANKITILKHSIISDCRNMQTNVKSVKQETFNEKVQGHRNSEEIFDRKKLKKIEDDTEASQNLLSNIFIEDGVLEDSSDLMMSESELDVMRILLSRDTWNYSEFDTICRNHNLITGYVLERINDYSYSILEDNVVSEDGDSIYVVSDYKNNLI